MFGEKAEVAGGEKSRELPAVVHGHGIISDEVSYDSIVNVGTVTHIDPVLYLKRAGRYPVGDKINAGENLSRVLRRWSRCIFDPLRKTRNARSGSVVVAAKKRQAASTRRKRVPKVFIEPTPITSTPRVEQGQELLNPKYKTEGFNKLLHYLAAERRMIHDDPVEPKETLDDSLFPALPGLFKDRWRAHSPEASLRVELLQLQAKNAKARFQDLLSPEERRIICEVVWEEITRRGVTLRDLYHKSGVPTPCQEFPLDLFARRGLSTEELCGEKYALGNIRSGSRKPRNCTPERIEVAYAWLPYDMLPREILQESKGAAVTLKGYAFCQLIRQALLVAWDAAGNPRTTDPDSGAFQVDWFESPIQQYFQVPPTGTLRWYSWIAQPLFNLLEEGDDWAWTRFAPLVDFLGWRRAQADLFRSRVTLPAANKQYQSLKRDILAKVGRSARKGLPDWFRRVEEQFVEGLQAFGEQALRVHWLTKDSQFVIPYLLLYIYCKRDLKRYEERVRSYLHHLMLLLFETPTKPERSQYEVWKFETMSRHDPWYSICLNWEIWVGSEDKLRAIFTPPKQKGVPLRFEVKRLVSGCLPLFGELSRLRVRSRIRRGMEICNALCGENLYPPGSETVFDRDVRRAIQKQAT